MTAPTSYGSWPSPVSAADVASASTRFDGARVIGEEIWWAQSVPEEGGRMAVRRRRDGHTWLLPRNSAFEPILGDDAVVLGKVVAVLRAV